MRSIHADRFNHDPDAPGYDDEVADETSPVRAGYSAVQSWIGSRVPFACAVLDLGCGTGNTILALPAGCTVTAIDVSERMLAVARTKTAHLDVEFRRQDVLEYVHSARLERFDVIVSSYALHHLTAAEKEQFFIALENRACGAAAATAAAARSTNSRYCWSSPWPA